MKMLVFVISLGVLYWTMTSFAQTRLAPIAPCPEPANVSTIGHAGDAAAAGDEASAYQLVQLASDTAETDMCGH
ncbi:hypothetical protein [Hyphococcus luteus]|uniref:Secreted protein n=1 Tax=Hyphococcus luteus TaxID=2058213 RepID=A0A2S7JYS1_9PROT|nr:hypothetical protein [Marinicaulis flavus]PQA85401.1 hypothetical protein CW354_20860 [Marinicaulis flavus]